MIEDMSVHGFNERTRGHCMAVLAPLAALDAQQHALGIDIAYLERDNLRDAQPGALDRRLGNRGEVRNRARDVLHDMQSRFRIAAAVR
jgi:hypothetical protein